MAEGTKKHKIIGVGLIIVIVCVATLTAVLSIKYAPWIFQRILLHFSGG